MYKYIRRYAGQPSFTHAFNRIFSCYSRTLKALRASEIQEVTGRSNQDISGTRAEGEEVEGEKKRVTRMG
jgi:hypothetical protein